MSCTHFYLLAMNTVTLETSWDSYYHPLEDLEPPTIQPGGQPLGAGHHLQAYNDNHPHHKFLSLNPPAVSDGVTKISQLRSVSRVSLLRAMAD